jgi:hypothetical protein
MYDYANYRCGHCTMEFAQEQDGDLWITRISVDFIITLCIRCRQDLGSTE